jgi:hypothetical protein
MIIRRGSRYILQRGVDFILLAYITYFTYRVNRSPIGTS